MHSSNKYFPQKRGRRKWHCEKITPKQLSGMREHDETMNGPLDFSLLSKWRRCRYRYYKTDKKVPPSEVKFWEERYSVTNWDGTKTWYWRIMDGAPFRRKCGYWQEWQRYQKLYSRRQYRTRGCGADQSWNGAWHNRRRVWKRAFKVFSSRQLRRLESLELYKTLSDPEHDFVDPHMSNGYMD